MIHFWSNVASASPQYGYLVDSLRKPLLIKLNFNTKIFSSPYPLVVSHWITFFLELHMVLVFVIWNALSINAGRQYFRFDRFSLLSITFNNFLPSFYFIKLILWSSFRWNFFLFVLYVFRFTVVETNCFSIMFSKNKLMDFLLHVPINRTIDIV